MALQFRKKLRILPGFTLNLSKTRMSAMIDINGLDFNTFNKGKYLNFRIPGTGIHDKIRLDRNFGLSPENRGDDADFYTQKQLNVEYEIKSYNPELLTSDSLFGLKQSILNVQKIREEMRQEYLEANSSKNESLFFLVISYLLIFGFFLKKIKASYIEKKEFAEYLNKEYQNFKLSIGFNFDKELLNEYISVKKSFEFLSKSEKKWKTVSFSYNDKFRERTTANRSITRVEINLYEDTLPFIETDFSALVFQNANGGNLFFYPGFLIIKEDKNNDFAIVDYRNLTIKLSLTNFHEDESVPSDSMQVGNTWRYSNKDGSRDRRFNGNYQIPVMKYGKIMFKNSDGVNEQYMFSSYDGASRFCECFYNYISVLSKMRWDVNTDYKSIEN